MSVKAEILKELKLHQDSYVSGQELCNKLGVSRTAVWKHMKALKEDGYVIDSVTNRGYQLKEVPDVLEKEEILTHLHTKFLGQHMFYYDSVDSTNLEARRLAEEGAKHGTLVIAEQQVAGRGRRGRQWETLQGTGISMSFVLRPEIPVECSSMLTLVTALAVADAMKEQTNLSVGIKWPNDIILHGKKLCGILTELSAQMDEVNYVIVGIGINVNMDAFPEEIQDVATSLILEGGQKVNRASLVAKILEKFEYYYDKFLVTSDLSGFVEEYDDMLVHKGQKVFVVRGGKKEEVLSLGIDRTGELMVQDDFGHKSRVISGEVSIRGILNYI